MGIINQGEEYEIQFLEKGRRVLNNQIYDIIDYRFTVSKGGRRCSIAVGISGVFHDPLSALGKQLTKQELIRVAEDWLRSRLAKGYDPLSGPEHYERIMQIPSIVMDFFVHNRTLPDWI